MKYRYKMKSILPYTSASDAIITCYETFDELISLFTTCWYGQLLNSLMSQKDDDVILLEFEDISLYNIFPRFAIEKQNKM